MNFFFFFYSAALELSALESEIEKGVTDPIEPRLEISDIVEGKVYH